MTIGDRVQLVNHSEVDESIEVILGTVQKCSPAGYTQVQWDEDWMCKPDWFAPKTAAQSLRVVTGDDAMPCHSWRQNDDATADPMACEGWFCRRCRITQTDENYWQRCNAAETP